MHHDLKRLFSPIVCLFKGHREFIWRKREDHRHIIWICVRCGKQTREWNQHTFDHQFLKRFGHTSVKPIRITGE
jgi:hypothetical protein